MRLRPGYSRWLCLGILAIALFLSGATTGAGMFGSSGTAWAQGASSVRPPSNAVDVAPSRPGRITPQGQDTQKWGAGIKVPTTASAQPGSSRLWRDIRRGVRGTVSIPNKKAGYLIQSQSEMWRQYRLSTLSNFGSWILLITVIALALFFLVRGRLKVEGGLAGKLIERFSSPERFAHWLVATSFIILGLSGLMLLYGREVLIPVFGREGFSALAGFGKLAHNYVGFAFIVGIVMMVVLWLRDNILDKYDIPWMLALGGFFQRGVHLPARKFNFGQKVIFWTTIGGGGLIAISGVMLLFPAERSLEGLQFLLTWHALLALILISIIIAHIYIGTLGMQGAFQAMGTGKVSENWAKQHHSVWVEEMKGSGAAKGKKA